MMVGGTVQYTLLLRFSPFETIKANFLWNGGENMHGKVNDDEWEIFRDAFRLYAAHCDPPENQAQDAEEWWLSMVKDTSEKAAKWNNHPLMLLLFRAVTEYVEQKAAGKTQSTIHK